MSNHIKIDEDYVKSLLEYAAWDNKLEISDEKLEEAAEEAVEEAEELIEEHVCPLCEST